MHSVLNVPLTNCLASYSKWLKENKGRWYRTMHFTFMISLSIHKKIEIWPAIKNTDQHLYLQEMGASRWGGPRGREGEGCVADSKLAELHFPCAPIDLGHLQAPDPLKYRQLYQGSSRSSHLPTSALWFPHLRSQLLRRKKRGGAPREEGKGDRPGGRTSWAEFYCLSLLVRSGIFGFGWLVTE